MELKRTTVLGLSVAVVSMAIFTIRSQGRDEVDHSLLNPRQLAGHVLTDSDAMAIPTQIAVVGSRLVAGDVAHDSAMHVFDRSTGELLMSLGRRGGGPGEFEGVWEFDPVAQDESAFWAYDLNLQRATLIDTDQQRSPLTASDARYVNFAHDATLTGPLIGAEGAWVSLGFFSDGRVGIFNMAGKRVAIMGAVPDGPESMVAAMRQHIRQSTLVPHPSRRRFVALPRYASDLEFIDLDGNTISVDGPVTIKGEFRDGPVRYGPMRSQESAYGYIDGAATDELIYALFSGRTEKDFKNQAVFARFVHVFDWTGQIVAVYKLEDDTLSMGVDASGSTLYALRHDPFPAIVSYDLPTMVETSNTLASDAHATRVQ